MLSLIDGSDEATIEEFGRIYTLVQERKAGLKFHEHIQIDETKLELTAVAKTEFVY